MCEPVTIATMVATGLGGVMSAYGQVQGGKAAQAEAEYQSGVARNNAMVSAAQARDAQERGDIEQAQYARQAAEFKGRQAASIAGSGIMAGEGSALSQIEDAAGLIHMDAENIRRSTERERLGFVNQQNQFLHQAQLLQAQGQAARRAGQIGALTTGLQTGANMAIGGIGAHQNTKLMEKMVDTQTRAQLREALRPNPRASSYFRFRPQGYQYLGLR